MKQGLKKAARLDVEIAGIGIDTWGVDYAYLDEEGRLISNPFCYADGPRRMRARWRRWIRNGTLQNVIALRAFRSWTLTPCTSSYQRRKAS